MSDHESDAAAPSGLSDLKRAHRGIWASGDYGDVAERLVNDVPPDHLVSATRLEPGMNVLDLAAGTGNVAIKAALAGARVTAIDLTPELFDRGRERARDAGVEIEWVEGDVEDLPFEDGQFDRVLSSFGIQFAPRHEVAAGEAGRVVRDDGMIATISWTPSGHIGSVLKAVGQRMPPPPDYASPPPMWGDEEHLRGLFPANEFDLSFERGINPFNGFESAEDWIAYMESTYGPTLKAREKLEPEDRWGELRREVVELTEKFDAGGPDEFRPESEYLLAMARPLPSNL